MDNTQGQNPAKSQESRIRALEIQVHTLTQTLAYVMEVTKPLVAIAEEAHKMQFAHGDSVQIHIERP